MPKAVTTYVTGIKGGKYFKPEVFPKTIAAVLVSITRETEYDAHQIQAIVNMLLRNEAARVLFIMGGALQFPSEPYRRRQLPNASWDHFSAEQMQAAVDRIKHHIAGVWAWLEDVKAGAVFDEDKLPDRAAHYALLSDEDELMMSLRGKETAFQTRVNDALKADYAPVLSGSTESEKIVRCSPWEEYQGNPRGDKTARRRFLRFLNKLLLVKNTYEMNSDYKKGIDDVVKQFADTEYKRLLGLECRLIEKQLSVDELNESLRAKLAALKERAEQSISRISVEGLRLEAFEATYQLPFAYQDIALLSQFYVLTEMAYQLVMVDRSLVLRGRDLPHISSLLYPGRMPASWSQNYGTLISPTERAIYAKTGKEVSLVQWMGVGFKNALPDASLIVAGFYGRSGDLSGSSDAKILQQLQTLRRRQLPIVEDRVMPKEKQGKQAAGAVGSPSGADFFPPVVPLDMDPGTYAQALLHAGAVMQWKLMNGNGDGAAAMAEKKRVSDDADGEVAEVAATGARRGRRSGSQGSSGSQRSSGSPEPGRRSPLTELGLHHPSRSAAIAGRVADVSPPLPASLSEASRGVAAEAALPRAHSVHLGLGGSGSGGS